MGIRRGDDADLADAGVGIHHALYLGRPDLVARCVDHAFQAVDDEEVTLLVVIAEVAGAEETLAVALEEDLRGFFGSVPVAEEDLSSEESRVGKEGVSQFRSRWSPYH